jgi:integrase
MKLEQIAKDYLRHRSVSRMHQLAVMRVAGRVRTLTKERVNDYIAKRLTQVSPLTVATERSILLSLWKHAVDSEFLPAMPRGIMRFKHRKPPTQAWTVEQVQKALKTTEAYNGRRVRWSRASKRGFLRAWILLAYETGARMGDIMALRGDWIDGETVRWVQSKTGDQIVKVLSPECLAVCREMLERSTDGTIIGWVCSRRQAMRLMREHLDSCGLGGSSKWFRRSGATHVEMQCPGSGRHHLGHRSVGIFESSYADWGQIRSRSPIPPRIA